MRRRQLEGCKSTSGLSNGNRHKGYDAKQGRKGQVQNARSYDISVFSVGFDAVQLGLENRTTCAGQRAVAIGIPLENH